MRHIKNIICKQKKKKSTYFNKHKYIEHVNKVLYTTTSTNSYNMQANLIYIATNTKSFNI